MSKEKEIKRFEDRFSNEVIEIDAVTGASGFSGGKAGKDIMWGATIDLIAWKLHGSNNKVIQDKYSLDCLVDDDGLKEIRNSIDKESIIRVKVSKSIDDSKNYFKLVEVIDNSYEDEELNEILQEALKPVFYDDEILGRMELNKTVNVFETDVDWIDSKVNISFDNSTDENIIKEYISTAHELYNNKKSWNKKVLSYAAEKLLDLANDWYEESREEYYEYFDPEFEEEDEFFKYDKITKERFEKRIEFEDIAVYPNGDFSVYCSDGNVFAGHCIIIKGNINGEFEYADMAG
ncbi:MAG: DUF2262 domain-containing protein [Clostridium sp.]|nr:DUF2262 domain-containing protein [Clostridium sp.]